jgi:hypothetical protein
LIDFVKQSKNPEYGKIPSLFFFIFMNLVFILSKGSEIIDTLIPEIAEAVKRIVIVSVFYPVALRRYYLA